MIRNDITIRPETEKDFAEIDQLVRRSFTEHTDYSDGEDVVALIYEIRNGRYYRPEMSFVALLEGKIVGHFMFSDFPLSPAKDGGYEYLKTRAGLVLAGMEGIRYRKNELQLQPGDRIYLYTDGVTEATDTELKLYGEARLQAVLDRLADAGPQEICDAVKADVDVFAGDAEQFDDITMLCLNYKGWTNPDVEENA